MRHVWTALATVFGAVVGIITGALTGILICEGIEACAGYATRQWHELEEEDRRRWGLR